jgi:diguanylate cyclase (GGDEF)-like protein
MNWRLSGYRNAEYTIIVLMLLFWPLMLYVGAQLLSESGMYLDKQRQVDKLHQQLHAMDAVLLTLQEAETGQRGYLLTGRKEYLHPYLRALENLEPLMESLPDTFSDEPEMKEKFRQIEQLSKRKLESLGYTIDLHRAHGAEAAITVLRAGTDREIMRALRSVINGIRVRKTASLNIEFNNAAKRQASTRREAILLFVLLVGFAALTVYVALRGLRLKRELAEQLRRDSHHDALTALPNRRFLEEMMFYSIAQASRTRAIFALLYIDLDGFKQINDHYGHLVGDALLKETARHFKETVRKADMVARLGGDEFAVLMGELHSVEEAWLLASRLEQAIDRPLLDDYPGARVTASIGIALYPEAGQTAEQLLLHADRQMYAAKRREPVSANVDVAA